jgi:hypothetical protein
MNADQLADELEPLPYSARTRRMVRLGQEAATNPEANALLMELERGDFYRRWLGLLSCYGSRDGERVLRALSDPSRGIRRFACGMVALTCNDVQVQAALESVAPHQRRDLLRSLLRRKRVNAIDAFLLTIEAGTDAELGSLLPYGSAEVAAHLLPQTVDMLGAHDWVRLARHHPEIAAATLLAQSAATPERDARLLWRVNLALPFLSDRRPDHALALVESIRRQTPSSRLELGNLARRRPTAIVDLMLNSGEKITADWEQIVHRLDTERILGLLGCISLPLHSRRYEWFYTGPRLRFWLGRLKPQQREAVFMRMGRAWQNEEGVILAEVIAQLPQEWREREARRHLALPALATRPLERMPYVGFLPWDEAREQVNDALHDPDADLRGAVYSVLSTATRYHRDRLPDLLAIILSRSNEQDPVRGAMLAGLTGLPPGIWRPEHLEDLGRALRAALNAADLSPITARYAEALVVRLLPFFPHWCAGWLATLAQERGNLQIGDLEPYLADRDVPALASALLPVLQAWRKRESEPQIYRFALSLGRRLQAFPELIAILVEVVQNTATDYLAGQILALLAAQAPDRFVALAPALLAADSSWMMQPVVYNHLHNRRQDLLTPYLANNAYKGRFATGRTRIILPFRSGFYRWTPAQCRLFAGFLDSALAEEKRDSRSALQMVAQLASLPLEPSLRLLALAGNNRGNQAIRDAALRALGRMDAGQGVPVLLEALSDDRARIAIYALRGVLLEMPAARALELLRDMPQDRVTVAKEMARLLGDLRTEAAYHELLAMERRDLHRDVRIAVLRGLWEHLERAETWPVLERHAKVADVAVAGNLVRIPADRLSPHALARLVALLTALLNHSDPTVRMATLQRCADLPVNDPERALLPPVLARLATPFPDEVTAAATTLFAICLERDAALIGEAIRRLLPDRRALLGITSALRAALAALAADPLTSTLQARLAICGMPWPEATALMQEMAATRALHADALAAAIAELNSKKGDRGEAVWLEEFERALMRSDDRYVRRLALAALVTAVEQDGWTADRLSRLTGFRNDSSALVAEAAQFILPAAEGG